VKELKQKLKSVTLDLRDSKAREAKLMKENER